MKNTEFLELLNLYVDHEISAEQAARLEAEVTSNAERRNIYRQYCLMQKGCSLLTGNLVESAPAPQRQRAAATSDTQRFWRWSGIFATSGLAAAACLVALMTMHGRTAVVPATASLMPASKAPSAETRVAAVPVRLDSVAAPLAGDSLQTVFNVREWNQSGADTLDMNQGDPLAWTDQVQFAPLAREVIDASPLLRSEPALLSTGPAAPQVTAGGQHQPIEDSAFQFQR